MSPINGEWAGGYIIAWDKEHGGYRGYGDGWQTPNLVTRDEVRELVEGRGSELAGAGASEASEGLVYHQQSLEQQLPGPTRGREPGRKEREARIDALDKVREYKADRAKRWRFTLEDQDGETFCMDSKAARLRRCQRRVIAWAKVLPRDSRIVRRAGKAYNIGPRTVMLTLTYRDPDGWGPNDIRSFMLGLRKLLGSALYAYAWVLEMQQRGAPHYHVLLYVKAKTDVPMPDEIGLWPHGLTRRETAKSPFYICKYVGKEYQKTGLPHGARMFAVCIFKASLSPDEMLPFRMSAAPAWLQVFILEAADVVGPGVKWSRCEGGGWIIEDTGEHVPSPYRLVSIDPWE